MKSVRADKLARAQLSQDVGFTVQVFVVVLTGGESNPKP